MYIRHPVSGAAGSRSPRGAPAQSAASGAPCPRGRPLPLRPLLPYILDIDLYIYIYIYMYIYIYIYIYIYMFYCGISTKLGRSLVGLVVCRIGLDIKRAKNKSPSKPPGNYTRSETNVTIYTNAPGNHMQTLTPLTKEEEEEEEEEEDPPIAFVRQNTLCWSCVNDVWMTSSL